MRKLILSMITALGVGLFSVPALAAIPANPVEAAPRATDKGVVAPFQEARLYCHRGNVFLHWGPCAQDRWRYGYRPYRNYRPIYRPAYRVYRPYYRPYYRYRRW